MLRLFWVYINWLSSQSENNIVLIVLASTIPHRSWLLAGLW